MGKGGLTPALLNSIRKELEMKRDSLTKNIRSELDEMSNAEGHHLADMDDLGGDANDEETSFKILEMGSAELKEIENALERIEHGSYGMCEECSEFIGLERLKALPFATMCIACKRLLESESLA